MTQTEQNNDNFWYSPVYECPKCKIGVVAGPDEDVTCVNCGNTDLIFKERK